MDEEKEWMHINTDGEDDWANRCSDDSSENPTTDVDGGVEEWRQCQNNAEFWKRRMTNKLETFSLLWVCNKQ